RHLPFVAEEAVDGADGNTGPLGDGAGAQIVVADLVEEVGAGVQDPGQPFGAAPLHGGTAERGRMGHGPHDACSPPAGEPGPPLAAGAPVPPPSAGGVPVPPPPSAGVPFPPAGAPAGPGAGSETVTSAVLSTGSPSTAHTEPSSA